MTNLFLIAGVSSSVISTVCDETIFELFTKRLDFRFPFLVPSLFLGFLTFSSSFRLYFLKVRSSLSIALPSDVKDL